MDRLPVDEVARRTPAPAPGDDQVRPELILLSRVAYRGQEVTGPRLRGLLALLAGEPRSGCGTTRLVEALWPDEQPEHPTKALQILVSRARSRLGPGLIARTPVGYRLALDEEQVDASAVLLRAAAGARHLRSGDYPAALAEAEAGLALGNGTDGANRWGGADLSNGTDWSNGTELVPREGGGDPGLDDPLSRLRAERRATYRSLERTRALALARLGRPAEAIETLTALVRRHPRDEEALLELLRAEAATVGPSAALARYEVYRRRLRDDLGTDPGPALQAGYHELLAEAAPPVRRGVAHEPNPLLGRDGDVAAVARLLRTSRVVSIVGPGGLGKTRLAHAVSRQADQRVVHFVGLAGLAGDSDRGNGNGNGNGNRDGDGDGDGAGHGHGHAHGGGDGVGAVASDVLTEVASALGVGDARRAAVGPPAGAADAITGIVEALGSGLLVLDNCEHVIRGVAELVRSLVSTSRDLRLLTTSRAPLGLSSEAVYLLPELDQPTCAELFVQRARAVRPDADLPAEAVAELCRQLDGLPLAVELAAVRVRVMSLPEIADALADRFALLRGGARDAPERHHTLAAVVGWSWNLLDPSGQAAMRALSIFPDGFTADAARHLLADPLPLAAGDWPRAGDAVTVLEHLVGQSLLKVSDTPAGARFRMLETVREFATARRAAAGETEIVIDRFLGWARDFGVAHYGSPFGAEPFPAAVVIQAEQDNLAHAVRLGLARADGAAVAATAGLLAAFWTVRTNYGRMATLAEQAGWLLSHYRPAPEYVEVTRAYAALATAYAFTINGPHAVRSLVLLRRLPPAPPDTVIRAIASLLVAAPALDAARLAELGDGDEPLLAAVASVVVSYLRENAGDPDGATAAAERMLAVVGRRDFPSMWILAQARLGELHLNAGSGARALRHLRAVLLAGEGLGDTADVIGLRWGMALASLQVGAFDDAEHWLAAAREDLADETFAYLASDLAVRGELRLARGEVDAGLGSWRAAVRLLASAAFPGAHVEPGLAPWALELKAAAVVAHARHGQLDLVREVVDELARVLPAMLAEAVPDQPMYLTGAPLYGALLLALAIADLDRGERTGDPSSRCSGARLVALAERFRYLRQFHPTMSAARARADAERADKAAYDEAASSYADLDGGQLRAAALTALRARPPL